MPLLALGPTTFLHLLIIVAGLCATLFFPALRRSVLPVLTPGVVQVLCAMIIGTVFSGMLCLVVELLYFTATAQHSTMKVVSAYFDEPVVVNELEITVTPSSTPASRLAALPVCRQEYQTNSLIDYLRLQGKDHFYAARKNLAFDFGITGYEGTDAQNEQLLAKLYQADCHQEVY